LRLGLGKILKMDKAFRLIKIKNTGVNKNDFL
jgi:hypothetical protein